MRGIFVVLLMLSVPGVAQQATPEEAEKKLASIEGRLTDATSGEPVRKGTVTLMQRPEAGVVITGPPPSSAATTDAEGKFSFTRLEPGTYSMHAEKTGYVRQQYGSRTGQFGPGTTLTLKAGDRLTGLVFALPRQAVITGRVLDDEGEPVSNAYISLLRSQPLGRQPQMVMGNMTNDVGEFRIANLTPGKYFVRAQKASGFGPAAAAAAAGAAEDKDKPRIDFVPTFYPGATDVSGASAVVVKAGQQLPGVDITLMKGRVYRVSGRATGIPAGTRVQISLQPQMPRQGGFAMAGMGGGATPMADGKFTIPSVLPGTYELMVMSYDEGRPTIIGRTQMSVSNANVDDVAVAVRSPLEITGRVIPDSEAPKVDPGATKVNSQVGLIPAERLPMFSMPVRVQDDGTFRLTGVPRGKLLVQVSGLPVGQFVKSVMAGSADVTESGLDLTNAESVPPIEIRLSAAAATVEGNVVDKDGKPVPSSMVTLLPHPYDPDQPSMMMRRKVATTDQTGRFSVPAIPPGEYRLYAWETFVPLNEFDAEMLKPFEKHSATVRLKEKARETVELKVVQLPQEQ